MRKFRTPGSVRGAGGNSGSYRDRFGKVDRAVLQGASDYNKRSASRMGPNATGWVLMPSLGRMGRRCGGGRPIPANRTTFCHPSWGDGSGGSHAEEL